MKSFLFIVPLALVATGCSAPAVENQAAPTAPKTAAPAPGTPVAKTDTSAPAQTASPYVVVDEAQPGMQPDLVKALAKVVVPPPPAGFKVSDHPVVLFETSQGPIKVELDTAAAPLQVKSFVYLVTRKFFDGTTFHRYVPGFVIQGGDPLTRDPRTRNFAGVGGPGYQIPHEVNKLTHEAFVIAAARSQQLDSAGSQFYFTLAPHHELDGAYTVFGKVISGKDVVSKLRQNDKLKTATLEKGR
jgi:peptidyl-prolyl cis-trans isomerase B (cyclophilin B)